ncbi:hypothetical protein M2347_004180 [Chryseobacterium sp. H1D6B]|uniref:hypothetical protein n=1 Tax=Chryseobacterium sp. H1D6B TaxID=2940588 RepID=UPI0015C7E941|nr:hypothetical protein [Chryseobacterium sp. H1D6B]MDH6254453.1 hypothetical protein [Chryseobacterium sp. H1D6B]
MKLRILIFIFLFSIKGHCQFMSLSKYDTGKYRETDNAAIYKIKGKIYETDHKTFFSSDKMKIFENKTNDVIYITVYNKRYLFIGYFPNTPEEIKLPFPYGGRALNKLDVIDLEDVSKTWAYKFDTPTKIKNMKSFNPKYGDITYCNHLKPEKSNQ